jgi:hypothetical protein
MLEKEIKAACPPEKNWDHNCRAGGPDGWCESARKNELIFIYLR